MQRWGGLGCDGGGFEFNQSSLCEIRGSEEGGGGRRAPGRVDARSLARKRNPGFFFHLKGGCLSQLVFHLGAAHSFIRQGDSGGCGGSAAPLHYSVKPGEIGPRRGIFNPPSSPSSPTTTSLVGMMCVQRDWSPCSLQRNDRNSAEGAAREEAKKCWSGEGA